MMRNFKDAEFVIFDVETTGLSPQAGDRVIEVAALKVKNLKEIDRYVTLVDPQRDISYDAFQVNGITNEMLKGAPKAENVLADIMDFLKGAYLVGHNIKFDLGFLNNEFLLAGWPSLEDSLTIDTMKMAKGLLPNLRSYSLNSIAYSLGIENEQYHRALADVETTSRVFLKLLGIAREKRLDNLDAIVGLFGLQGVDQRQTRFKIDTIVEAIETGVPLNILYFGIKSGTTLRKVIPLKLLGEGRDTTLVGFCHLRGEERNFKLDRIVNLEKSN